MENFNLISQLLLNEFQEVFPFHLFLALGGFFSDKEISRISKCLKGS